MDTRSRPLSASEWLVALLEAPDDAALRMRFSAWLRADPEHARDWDEIARTYEVLGQATPVLREQWAASAREGVGPRPLPQVAGPGEPASRRRPGRTRLRWRVAGMAAALAAGLAVLLLPGIIARLGADYTTGPGETRSVRLADGSTVRLAPESAIAIDFSEAERRVRLIAGRAFFEVAANAARPFRVGADVVETSVLGTAFEVRLEADATGVAVRQGTVQVRNDAATPPVSELLGAGDWARLSWGGGHTHGRSRPEDVAAWQDGLLIAKDRPVGQVVDELRPYYGGIVLLHGDRLAHQPLTGIYSLADPVAALSAIARTQGAALYRLSPWVIVISGGPPSD